LVFRFVSFFNAWQGKASSRAKAKTKSKVKKW
jgi:hypothetical protein